MFVLAKNYDLIAPIYDGLSKLIFGNKLKKIQCHFLNEIPEEGQVLILGGGTGWILEEIEKYKPKASIVYIDASAKMIAKAKKKKSSTLKVQFVMGTELSIPAKNYDVLITNFYLDLFPQPALSQTIDLLAQFPIKTWIVSDFVPMTQYKYLEKLMFFFFKISTNIQNKKLYPYADLIQNQTNFHLKTSHHLMQGYITSFLFEK